MTEFQHEEFRKGMEKLRRMDERAAEAVRRMTPDQALPATMAALKKAFAAS